MGWNLYSTALVVRFPLSGPDGATLDLRLQARCAV
jgi:hypothetical protein